MPLPIVPRTYLNPMSRAVPSQSADICQAPVIFWQPPLTSLVLQCLKPSNNTHNSPNLISHVLNQLTQYPEYIYLLPSSSQSTDNVSTASSQPRSCASLTWVAGQTKSSPPQIRVHACTGVFVGAAGVVIDDVQSGLAAARETRRTRGVRSFILVQSFSKQRYDVTWRSGLYEHK